MMPRIIVQIVYIINKVSSGNYSGDKLFVESLTNKNKLSNSNKKKNRQKKTKK